MRRHTNTHCKNCKSPLDRKGNMCWGCMRQGRLISQMKVKRDGELFNKWKKSLSQEEMNKFFDDAMKQVIKEEKEDRYPKEEQNE